MATTTSAPVPTPPAAPVTIGVGIDTSRYGHVAAFLSADLQPAAAQLRFAESGTGYAQLHARLEQLARKHPGTTFAVRIDAAGQYADNLIHFLQRLANPPQAHTGPLAGTTLTLSCGDPQRNKNYRAALFGTQTSDPIEALAAARYALTEHPTPTPPMSDALRTLRQVAARLQAVVRQRTRLINPLHQLLALTFPERALRVKDISAGWVLELVHRYPTAPRLAGATPKDLGAIPYLPDKHIQPCSAPRGLRSGRSRAHAPRNWWPIRCGTGAISTRGRRAWKTCWLMPIGRCRAKITSTPSRGSGMSPRRY
jgi:hypothetical protein